ncbi:hypothetical protein [Streptomyces sp. NPDC060035]|uniref:hypothetical protein n=1 Tax=Streptomyces sp. NPDC060035 TaxID=3347044 RepID=UPI00368C96A8
MGASGGRGVPGRPRRHRLSGGDTDPGERGPENLPRQRRDRRPHPDPRIVRVRHPLARLLYRQDRYEAAVEQFRAIDGYIGSAPWTYSGNPRKRCPDTPDHCAA